jgi:hypothetical protein
MWQAMKEHPVRFFALLCVAATSLFLMLTANRLIDVLASPDWCSKALQAERISSEKAGGLTSCVDLLTIQVKSLAVNSHIVLGVFAMCLLVLIVIVIAGGKLSFAASKDGLSANVGRERVEAAKEVAEAAEEKKDEIVAGAGFTAPPGEEL